MSFFKNDWFMGPFYSYDHNEKDLAKEWHFDSDSYPLLILYKINLQQ
jgi:hypothetical protein